MRHKTQTLSLCNRPANPPYQGRRTVTEKLETTAIYANGKRPSNRGYWGMILSGNRPFAQRALMRALLPVYVFVSSCASSSAQSDELPSGISRLSTAPCEQVEAVVPIENDTLALYCATVGGARVVFFDTAEQRIVREINAVNPSRIGSGRLSIGPHSFWASLEYADNGSSDAVEQSLALYGIDGAQDRRIAFQWAGDRTIVGAYFNSLANCAVLRVQSGSRRDWTAFSAEVILLDFQQLWQTDLRLRDGQDGIYRIGSSSQRRLDHPGASMMSASHVACLRLGDQSAGLAQSFTERLDGASEWRSALELVRTDGDALLRERDLTTLSRSLKVFYPVSLGTTLVAAIADENAPRLANISLLILDSNGETSSVPPLPQPLSWQFFDAAHGVGLALTVRERGVERGALNIVDCRRAPCAIRSTEVVVDRPLQFLAQEIVEGILPVRACVANDDVGCEWQLLLVHLDQLMETF